MQTLCKLIKSEQKKLQHRLDRLSMRVRGGGGRGEMEVSVLLSLFFDGERGKALLSSSCNLERA